jgi:outer membrane receptor for ferrienterochelin and colicin
MSRTLFHRNLVIIGLCGLMNALTFTALTIPTTAYATTTATLSGAITQLSGEPIMDAVVNVTASSMIGTRSMLTDQFGRYQFTGLSAGSYLINVVHPSYKNISGAPVTLTAGAASSIDGSLALTSKRDVESSTTTGSAIDTSATHTGLTVQGNSLVHNPSVRTLEDAVGTLPGVLNVMGTGGSAGQHIHGSFATANQYSIDGVNTSDPLDNRNSVGINIDAIESIQLLTSGLDAEYGRTLGGVVNVTTKSGGETWRGTSHLDYTGSAGVLATELSGDNFEGLSAGRVAFNLGGPVLAERVWVYTSLQGALSTTSNAVDTSAYARDFDSYPLQPEKILGMNFYNKVTAKITSKQDLRWTFSADPAAHHNILQNPTVLPAGEAAEKTGGWLTSLNHGWQLSDSTRLESTLSSQTTHTDTLSMLWLDCADTDDNGACLEDLSKRGYLGQPIGTTFYGLNEGEYSSGAFQESTFSSRSRHAINIAMTNAFDFLGRHNTKTGVSIEALSATTTTPGDGTVYYAFNDGDSILGNDDPTNLNDYSPAIIERSNNSNELSTSGTSLSWYLQDIYKPTKKLTIRPGVRIDAPSLKNADGAVIYKAFNVAPRLGVAFALNDKEVIHGHVGRYYDTGQMLLAQLLASGGTSTSGYEWDGLTNAWSETASYTNNSAIIAHSDLKSPYADELHLGYNRDVGSHWTLISNVAYEVSRGFWEDDEVNQIWNDEGTAIIGYRDGSTDAIYRLRTPDDLYTRYATLEFAMQRTFGENLSMLASYTYSNAVGTNSEDSASATMDIGTLSQFEEGMLTYDVPHNIKLMGTYQRPDTFKLGGLSAGYLVGWNLGIRSGLPYRTTLANGAGYDTFDSAIDGTDRLPAMAQADLRAALTLGRGEHRVVAGVDVTNIFNDRATTSIDSHFDPAAVGDDQTYGDILSRQAPRTVSLVVRGEF